MDSIDHPNLYHGSWYIECVMVWEGAPFLVYRRMGFFYNCNVLCLQNWVYFRTFCQKKKHKIVTKLDASCWKIVYMWCNQSRGISWKYSTCDIFSFLFDWSPHLRGGTFCWKLHLNRSSGSKVMSNWRFLRTIENNRNSFLFLTVSHNHWCRLPNDPTRLQHTYTYSEGSEIMLFVV